MDDREPLAEFICRPGEYWVGDPCYAIPESAWISWLDATNWTGPVMAARIPGARTTKPAVGVTTAHGDGSYRGTDGFDYGVDSGTIGVVPVEATKRGEHAGIARNSSRVNFDSPFAVRREGTVIVIGHIRIETDW